MSEKTHYIVTFREPGEERATRLRVQIVEDSPLGPAFLTVSGLLFGYGSRTLVDPVEEALQRRFKDVVRLHLQLYNVVSIEEVGDGNPGLSTDVDRSKVIPLQPPPGG